MARIQELTERDERTGAAETDGYVPELVSQLQKVVCQLISSEIPLPQIEEELIRKCRVCNELLEPVTEDALLLLRERRHHGCNPESLKCTACGAAYGAQDVLLRAITNGFDRLNLGPFPDITMSRSDIVQSFERIKWAIQIDSSVQRPEAVNHDARLLRNAAIWYDNNAHDPRHRLSCYKKGASACRYHVPHISVKETNISLEVGDNGEVSGLIIDSKRSPANMYITPGNASIMETLFCNNNVQYVKNCKLSLYYAAYHTKVSKENSNAVGRALHSALRHLNRGEQRNVDDGAPSRTPFADGMGRLLSAVRAHTSCEVVGAQLAAYLLLGHEVFRFSHQFSVLPIAQGVAYLNGKPLHTVFSMVAE